MCDIAWYKMQTFTTWEAFLIKEKTVLRSSKLWSMMGLLFLVSLCVAALTALLTENPATLKVSKFTEVSKFLNVVTGLMMGFFLSSSMKRWFSCVDGFLQLLDAIRSLQLQFIGLGVPQVELGICLRYGLLSAWVVYYTLLEEANPTADHLYLKEILEKYEGHTRLKRLHARKTLTALRRKLRPIRDVASDSGSPRPQAVEDEDTWIHVRHRTGDGRRVHRCSTWAQDMLKAGTASFLSEKEFIALSKTNDPAAMLWVWVAGLIGRLAQDGFVPPMRSPTYGRIMNLCEMAHTGIRVISGCMRVQPPLIYTQMLALLVHLNNLLNAITFGLVLGLAVGTTYQEHDAEEMHMSAAITDALAVESLRDFQSAFVTFLYCSFGPLIYQSLLLIGMALAQPFDSEEARIPLDRFILALEQDLLDGNMVANNMCFDHPCFKPPYRSSGGICSAENLHMQSDTLEEDDDEYDDEGEVH